MCGVERRLFVILLGALTIAGCVHARPNEGVHFDPGVSTDACIRVEDLAEWDFMDDRSILLSVPGQPRGYLITLVTPMQDLRFAKDIDVIDGDHNGFICADGVDQVNAVGCSLSPVSIASIEYLSERRTAELLGEGPIIL